MKPPYPDMKYPPQLTFQERIQALMTLQPEQLKIFDLMATGGKLPSGSAVSLRLLTIKEASEKLNIGRSTLERLIEEGSLPCVTLRKGRRRVRECDLKDLVFNDAHDESE